MTQRDPIQSLPVRAPSDCWRTIGVLGDRSCGLLEEHIHCRNCPVFAAAGKMFFDREAPPKYDEEWAERLAPAQTAAPAHLGSALVFRVGPQWFAVDFDLVAEVAPTRKVARIPHRSNDVLLGLVNIRGELRLCASFHGMFGLSEEIASANQLAPRRMVVLQRQRAHWVIPVEEVAGIRKYSESDVHPVSDSLEKSTLSLVASVIQFNGISAAKLDAERLWAALERSVV